MNRNVCVLATTFLILILNCIELNAQGVSTAQITGNVRDQSGAVLPGVEVTVTQTDTGALRTTVSDETGSYTLTNLPIGPYRLEAALSGFRTYVQTGIVLQVNSNPVLNAVLEVGQVNEQIEVQANAAMVETRSTGVGQMIDNQRILELPLNGRQASDLILMTGMATVSRGDALNSGSRNYPTQIISIAGGLSTGATFLLDGGTHNDPYNNLNMPFPFPDALQEFKVETSALPAQYGQHSAGAVNAVTKSGTNGLHGGLFDFVRNGSLNARNAFALRRDSLKRNQFGGILGGPVVRNKLFFFGGYQGTTLRNVSSAIREYIPTAAMLAGDFTDFTSPACNAGRQITLPAPFVNNRVAPSQLSSQAVSLARRLPTTTDPCGLIVFGRRSKTNENLIVGRMDYQWSSKNTLFGRYMQARLDGFSDIDPQNILALSIPDTPQRVHSFVLGDTYILGTGTVSNFRATLNRAENPLIPPTYFDFSDLGVNARVITPKVSITNVNGAFNISTISVNYSLYNWWNYQLSEDLSIVHGAHQIGVGANFIRSELTTHGGERAVPTFAFNGQSTGLSMSDFLLGRPSSFAQGNPRATYQFQNVFGAYVQDTWKLNPRLTVNAGLRWDPFIPIKDKDGVSLHFDKTRFDQGLHSSVYVNAPPGLIFPGDPGMPPNNAFHFNDLSQFAPRLGVVFDPKGDGRMTIRAAYGMFYDMPQMFYYNQQSGSQPWGANVTVISPPGGFANPWQDYPGGDPFPLTITKNASFSPGGGYVSYLLRPKLPYVHQWNLSVQKQIAQDWMVSANYSGNSSIHLWTGRDIDPPLYLPGSSCTLAGRTFTPCSSTANTAQRTQLSVENPAFGQYFTNGISELDDGGTANYHGLQLSVQRRRSNGFTLQGTYTYSHCITDLVNYQPTSSRGTRQYLISDNRRFDRGDCQQDIRQTFNLSTVYATPRISAGILGALASNWQLSGITRLLTGAPFSLSSGIDTSLTGNQSRANQVLADPYAPNNGVNQWLNPAAFTVPVTGTWGNMGRNTLRSPGLIQIDVGISRTFAVRERQTLQLRVEAFNLPNHVNPVYPLYSPSGAASVALNDPKFGQITAAADPRILQIALKYVF
jgi:outer membrane receptor protein involved in Fe transport